MTTPARMVPAEVVLYRSGGRYKYEWKKDNILRIGRKFPLKNERFPRKEKTYKVCSDRPHNRTYFLEYLLLYQQMATKGSISDSDVTGIPNFNIAFLWKV